MVCLIVYSDVAVDLSASSFRVQHVTLLGRLYHDMDTVRAFQTSKTIYLRATQAGRYSPVGIATRYGLDGAGIENR